MKKCVNISIYMLRLGVLLIFIQNKYLLLFEVVVFWVASNWSSGPLGAAMLVCSLAVESRKRLARHDVFKNWILFNNHVCLVI